jgi:hypothetical protein
MVLRILPGTVVVFDYNDEDGNGYGDYGLQVSGGIIAEGTAESPIVFKPKSNLSSPGRWFGITMENARPARFSYCRFHNASRAIDAHYTDVEITSSLFMKNLYGVDGLGKNNIAVSGNLFFNNETAIQYLASEPVIRYNHFKSNFNAIVSLGWSSKSIVQFNNFTSGRKYNIALGANQVNDIDARFNFWGSSSDENIQEMLHDGTDENGLGIIQFIPAERNMIKLEDIKG